MAPSYNFLDLSPVDFEELSRDLLQKSLGVTFESFAPGPDRGIDFRHTSDSSEGTILQCKRSGSWKSLHDELKLELPKIKVLNPKRYILSTAHSLTVRQHDKVLEMLTPFVRNKADVIGREGLNNLLAQFPDVERQHPKLWLSSTHVLERILHSRIHNQTQFEEEKIKQAVKVYVQNESFSAAAQILNERRFVIISGIPGIGKSTLARMLIFRFLAEGFDELIAASESINEIYDLYRDERKQIFFFDDFLGRVFLGRQLSTNEDQRIARLMERVAESKNKIFILTTREYILSQAREQFDSLDGRRLDLSKYVIDLSSYTRLNRARILYNHIYYSELGPRHVQDLLKGRRYLQIIDHPNYSPRTVEETLMIEDIWNGIEPTKFAKTFKGFLDDPQNLWRRVYDGHISRYSQCLLANLLSAGTPIRLEDLQKLTTSFAQANFEKYGLSYSESEFNRSLRELEGTFLVVNKTQNNRILVSFLNPSIEDFLLGYLSRNKELIKDIIRSAPFFNQLYSIFTLQGSKASDLHRGGRTGGIRLSGDLLEQVVSRVLNDWDSMDISTIRSADYGHIESENKFSRLGRIIRETKGLKDKRIDEFLVNQLEPIKDPSLLSNDDEFEEFAYIAATIGDRLFGNKKEVVAVYFDQIDSLNQIEYLKKLKGFVPGELKQFIGGNVDRSEKLRELFNDELTWAEDDRLEDLREYLDDLEREFGIFVDDIAESLDKKVADYREGQENEITVKIQEQEDESDRSDDEIEIVAMLESLRG